MEDDEIVSLETSLDRAISRARAAIAAFPPSIDLVTEIALGEVASEEACLMARNILSRRGARMRVCFKATAWLDGTYPAEAGQ